jgi:CBS domain-containing protein
MSGNVVQGLWLGLIGLFLNAAAQSSYRQVVVRQILQGEQVARFMTVSPITVPSSLDLQTLVEDYRFHRKSFPVVDEGSLVGFVQTTALADFPRDSWDHHTVAEAMSPDWQTHSVPPDADAMYALEKMQQTGSSRLLVVDTADDRLQGIVTLKDLLRFLDLRLELEDAKKPPQESDSRRPPREDERRSA